MKKCILLTLYLLFISSALQSKPSTWSETATTLTEFMQVKENKLEEIIYHSPRRYIYHIRGVKEFIICIVEIKLQGIPDSTICYTENF
tara:strand:- start:701 stop:964 length:264 start_codon:yes stop_codon:yes gene_type:complete